MLSSTLGWLLLEAGLGYAALWLMNTSELGIFDIFSLCGYKYVKTVQYRRPRNGFEMLEDTGVVCLGRGRGGGCSVPSWIL